MELVESQPSNQFSVLSPKNFATQGKERDDNSWQFSHRYGTEMADLALHKSKSDQPPTGSSSNKNIVMGHLKKLTGEKSILRSAKF